MTPAQRSARYRARHPGRHAENQARYALTTKGLIAAARKDCCVTRSQRALETHEAQD